MVLFELGVIVICLAFFIILRKLDPHIPRKFGITFIAVLLFEYFTQPLWLNVNLERWAYLYLDVSWIITLGWTTIILVSMAIIDLYFPKDSELERFIFYFIPITIIGIVAETVVLGLGIRQYPPAVLEILSGYKILGRTPIEALYYIPVFMALVISFARYWEISFGERVEKIAEAVGFVDKDLTTSKKYKKKDKK